MIPTASFKQLKHQKVQNTTLTKHVVSHRYSFFLHYINIWKQKVQNSVFYAAFLPESLESSREWSLQNTVNAWYHMSCMTLRFRRFACGGTLAHGQVPYNIEWMTQALHKLVLLGNEKLLT